MRALAFNNPGSILISALIAAFIGLHVARGIRKAGVEYYGGRILIFSAITNTVSVALMLLVLGATGLRSMLTPAGFRVVDLTIVVLFLILPVRAIWNCIRTPGRITRRFGLTPLRIEHHQTDVVAVARAMGIPVPTLLSSPRCRTPFVFGRTSRGARLALPETWSCIDADSRHIMLCHELAHIRNLDVGFLTWSFAFLRDLKWALLLSPVVMGLSLLGGQAYLPRAAALYVACLLILWFLANSVVRSREMLADATVAMLIDSGKIFRTFDEILLTPETGLRPGDTRSPGRTLRIKGWLSDKAMFSKRPTFWKAVARFAELSLETHPSVSMRLNAIRGGRTAGEDSSVRNGGAWWAGLTLGLLAVLIALGGFWTGKFMLGWQDDEQIVLLSYDCWGSIAPLAGAFVALFFVLPAWSSLRPHVPTVRNLARFGVQYLYGLLGACCVLPLILLGGWSHIEIKLLFVFGILWVLVVLAMGIVVNVVMLSLWLLLRYKQRHSFLELAWILYSSSVGVLAIFCYFASGLLLISGGQALAGGSVLFGLLVGLATFVVISKDSVVSGTDQYMVIAPPPVSIKLEGRTYRRWSPLVGALYMMAICLVPAAVVSTLVYQVAFRALGHTEELVAVVILLVLGSAILLFLDWRWPRRMQEACRQKTGALVVSQIILQKGFSAESSRIVNRILANLLTEYDKGRALGTMTTHKTFELTVLASHCGGAGHQICQRARQWARDCETPAGFGAWPFSGPRLSSTYQCLQMLQITGGIQVSDSNGHASWIRSLQTSDGSFWGPWSCQSRWEDTFHAVTALSMLGSRLDEEAKGRCLDWLRKTLIREGMEKGQLDAFHYCLAAVHALYGLDAQTAETTGQWLSTELDRLLLTNVAHNAENVHHAVCAYRILKERGISLGYRERIALLADRVNDALEAELAALRT